MFYNPSPSNTLLLADDVQGLSAELSHTVLPQQPTKDNILAAMRWLVADAKAGELLYLHYSGHGSQQRDTSGDEEDRQDECICPLDMDSKGMIIDDDIRKIVDLVPEGAYCLMEMDCCHSSSAADLREVVTVVETQITQPPKLTLPAPPTIHPLNPHPVILPIPPPQVQYPPFNPQKIIKIGGIPHYAYPLNPLFVRRETREYPCIVFKYNSESQRASEFREVWERIVNDFCVNNGVRAYEEIASEDSRHPCVRFYYSESQSLPFYIPENEELLNCFLVDRNNVRLATSEHSRGLFSQLQAYTINQLKNYVSNVGNMVSNFLSRSRDLTSPNGRAKYSIKTYQSNSPTRGVVVVWSGCKDDQTSADSSIGGTPVGAMTHYHLQASSDSSLLRNIDILIRERELLKNERYDQIPQLSFGHSGEKLMAAPYPLHASRMGKTPLPPN
jgi:hypothetical protein